LIQLLNNPNCSLLAIKRDNKIDCNLSLIKFDYKSAVVYQIQASFVTETAMDQNILKKTLRSLVAIFAFLIVIHAAPHWGE
jgi:hypothetical protein